MSSVSWPRVMPTGKAESLNTEGLKYYQDAVDALLAASIEPLVTLYHYDLPSHLEHHEGGWLNRSVVERFAEYADVMFGPLPRVKLWLTINEPHSIATGGYLYGEAAPGR